MKKEENNESILCCENSDSSVNIDPTSSCSTVGCDCGNTVKRKTQNIAICLVVLLAVVGIISYKTVFATTATKIDDAAFAFSAIGPTLPDTDVNTADQNFGESLNSLNDLNKLALGKDVVFVFVPGLQNTFADDVTRLASYSAQQTLDYNNIISGLYTLPSDSSDYSIIADQVQTPAVLVVVKGSGMVAVPVDNISEETLLQAYLSCCSSGSSCCP
jgi:hypothetical protein